MKNLKWFMAVLMVGCAQTVATPQPPQLKLGEMACSRCGMSIDDGKFAAARQIGSEVRVYDDLGELFEERAQKPAADEVLWVRDYNDQQWLEARTCRYVRGEKIRSPMGYQIAAAADNLTVSPLAARWGVPVLDFEALQNQFKTQEEK